MICQLQLANGWTVSISEDDTPPALCSVAAWQTKAGNQSFSRMAAAGLLFEFDDRGSMDRRCWSLADVREALMMVQNAAPLENT